MKIEWLELFRIALNHTWKLNMFSEILKPIVDVDFLFFSWILHN